MECDSIHSAISREFKRVGRALWPEDWRNNPDNVHELETNKIQDFKKFVSDNLTTRKKDENGTAVRTGKKCVGCASKYLIPSLWSLRNVFMKLDVNNG